MSPEVKQSSPSFEEFQRQIQTATMNNAKMMLLTLLAAEPPVSTWPEDVRVYLSRTFVRAAGLFVEEGKPHD